MPLQENILRDELLEEDKEEAKRALREYLKEIHLIDEELSAIRGDSMTIRR